MYVILVALTIIISSCGVSRGLTKNVNNNTTQVVLSKNNYKIIEKVEGKSTARYFLGLIGGLSKKSLLTDARNKMLANANLIGTSRAIINESVQINITGYLIYTYIEYTVSVSGYVIEFTD